MAEYVLDTDVLIDHLRQARAIVELVDQGWAYSVVTRCELFAGSDHGTRIQTLLDEGLELPVTSVIAEWAGAMRRAARIATPDALIAATAVQADRTLVTRNVRHFERVPGLRVITPGELS